MERFERRGVILFICIKWNIEFYILIIEQYDSSSIRDSNINVQLKNFSYNRIIFDYSLICLRKKLNK